MSKETKNQSDGGIPPAVLNGLNQFTIGGFVLFYFNSKDGLPDHIMSFDSPVHAVAMEKYMEDWTEAFHDLQISMTKSNIINDIKSQQALQEPPENTEIS